MFPTGINDNYNFSNEETVSWLVDEVKAIESSLSSNGILLSNAFTEKPMPVVPVSGVVTNTTGTNILINKILFLNKSFKIPNDIAANTFMMYVDCPGILDNAYIPAVCLETGEIKYMKIESITRNPMRSVSPIEGSQNTWVMQGVILCG